jgi:hypothetical protein
MRARYHLLRHGRGFAMRSCLHILIARGHRLGRVVFARKSRAAARPPRVQLRAERVDGSELVMKMAMDRHGLTPFPALHGADVALQIGGDFLPRVQPAFLPAR